MERTNGRTFIHTVGTTGVIVAVNQEWLEFAKENDAPELVREAVVGRPLWDFMTDRETRHISRLLFEKALRSGESITIPYRCDSPGIKRFLEMEIVPMKDGTVEFRSSYLKFEPRTPVSLLDRGASRGGEFITICSWCRRVRLANEWVELDEAVRRLDLFSSASLPQLSHGICQDCNRLVHEKTGR